MKYFLLVVLSIGSILTAGCGGEKSADSATSNQPMTKADLMNNNQSSNSSVNPVAQLEQEAKAASASQNANAGEAKMKIPSFLDMSTGGITDLPAYPNSRRYNIQYGPMQGADSAMVIYMTPDPMEKVATFYEGVVKRHAWKVVSNVKEPESIDMKLTKGGRDEAILRFKKNLDQRVTEILISRIQKPLETKSN